MLGPSSASGVPSTGPRVLTTVLQVWNMSPQPRYFPTDRLQVTNESGSSFRPTLCHTTTNPLIVGDQMLPNASDTGSACWFVNSGDVSNATIYVDPPPGDNGRPAVFFALPPILSAEAGTAPPAVLSPLPVLTDAPSRVAPSGNPNLPALDPATCAVVYNAWARASGAYLSPACPATNGTIVGAGVASSRPGVPACLLYPSAAQPTTGGGGYGTVQAAAQPATGGVGSGTVQLSSIPAVQPTVRPVQPTVVPVQGPASGMAC